MCCKKIVEKSETTDRGNLDERAALIHFTNCKADSGWTGIVWKMTYAAYLEKVLLDGK